jgi:hypothetical protein
MSDPTQTPKTIKILREDGPKPPSELSLWPELRDSYPVHTFRPEPAKHTTGVAYLSDEHDAETVVAAYLEVNDWTDADETTSPTAWKIHNRIADEYPGFTDAARNVLGPFPHLQDRDIDRSKGGECPMCGEQYGGTLPDHLPCG